MINVMRYLLRFIMVLEATTSDHKLFLKNISNSLEIFLLNIQKNQTDEGACTGLILYVDTQTVKQLLGNLLKVETIVHFCLLVSQRKLFYFSYLDE